MNAKKVAAEKAVDYIDDGMIVGLGTGSTVYWAIQKIGKKVKKGMKICTISSSVKSEALAKELHIPYCSFSEIAHIDITIDGADAVDEKYNLVKGGGGALLREKILAYNSEKFVVIVDDSKLVKKLGAFPLPVEVTSFAVDLTLKNLQKLGCIPQIRMADDVPYTSDNGNRIIDCSFTTIADPAALNTQIHLIPGVIETGLFLPAMIHTVIVGYANGATETKQVHPS